MGKSQVRDGLRGVAGGGGAPERECIIPARSGGRSPPPPALLGLMPPVEESICWRRAIIGSTSVARLPFGVVALPVLARG